jgi:cyclic beta-1,2-glucan synthetase
MPEDHANQVQEQNLSFLDNSSSSKAEQTQDLVNALVNNYQEARRGSVETEKKAVLGGHDLQQFETWLAEAHTYFREASNRELTLTLASEWVLDNYYIIRQAVQQIDEDLPIGYYRELPKLTNGPLKGLPRIYAMARSILSFQNYLLNVTDMQTVLVQVQERVPLTMGELWALPIFLRYSLVETLAHALRWIIHPKTEPDLPALPPQLSGSAEPFMVNPTAANDTIASGVVANIILSLRNISEQNWNDLFESISSVERMLRKDPGEIYPWMDFKTRDLYRKQIEKLALASGREESELTKIILGLALENSPAEVNPDGVFPESSRLERVIDDPRSHVGEYLLGKSRASLEQRIGYHPNTLIALKRWGLKFASGIYLSSILVLSLIFLALISLAIRLPALLQSGSVFLWVALLGLALALLVPILTVSASLVNWLITLTIKPHYLPKLHFREEVPAPFQTLVVIPALITSHDEVDSLTRQLEMHYLRNPEPGLLFALLTDFKDADSETLPEDDEMVQYASAAIEQLNAKYKRATPDCEPPEDANPAYPDEESAKPAGVEENPQLFYLLHRRRLWNQSEGRWMGWERKRGKLHELNRLLRGGKNLSFSTISGDSQKSAWLQCIRFVITLDADTILPRGAARRLAGTLAHPLNHARFNTTTGQVISGYTVLQPRMEIHPRSANHSWFTRIFAGDTGLDLYTRAVSDAYQDLFGEGRYVGKGIYDIDAFEKSVADHIPENSVLSHDLLEGVMGRAGLVTDITMIEDYPSNYTIQIKRQQRWIRGDWQLLPWLIRPGNFGVKFSAIDRWKMLDNLLRAMLAPALAFIFFLGSVATPNRVGFWTAVILLSLGIPLLTSMARSALQTMYGENITAAFRPLKWDLVRWALAVAFLPYEAYNALDAILTTLYRLLISHHDLLQWTTAAQTAHLFGLQAHRNTAWVRMTASALLALLLAVGIQLVYQIGGNGVSPALAFAAPMLILWAISPLIAQWINRPILKRVIPLSEAQEGLFRQVARRTWGFFERFVGPEDHWLPPDHFQESPVGIIAHHTSPSNIGLLLTSTLAAYDLGYLDQLGLATRLSTTMETLDQLERFRGHFLNWYDTLTLQPLHPRYISTVDSGNLAASLIVTAQACKSMPDERIFRWDLWQGYLDTLANLTESLTRMRKPEFDRQVEEINRRIAAMHAEILGVQTEPSRWFALFQTASGEFWQDLSNRLIELVKVGRSAFDLETLRKLQEVAAQVDRHHVAIQRTITELVPWIPLLEQVPVLFNEPQYREDLKALRDHLPYNPPIGQIHTYVGQGSADTNALRDLLKSTQPVPVADAGAEVAAKDASAIAFETVPAGGRPLWVRPGLVEAWLDALDQAMAQAETNASVLIDRFIKIAERAEQYVKEMDFQFLYSPQRRLFHNGFNLDAGQLDNNYYDLLASEARIASIIALAKGEVPQSHWLQLSRPLTRVEGSYVLLSWSATMFEYLMPPLFLRSYPGTLLADSTQGAVMQQIAYGKLKGVPWGISESGFYRFDANQNYQYRAFGVPGLGFKRGLGDDLVIAPYASLMAISYDPHAVAENLASLMQLNSFGLYGLYESIDFTTNRLLVGDTSTVVREYMIHHQGMIMMALVNFFHKDIMVNRMHNDPRIQSVELLLQEQIPHSVPLQNPYAEDVKGVMRLTAAPVEINPWSVPVHTAIPQVNLLSNGNYGVLLSNMGGGYSTWKGIDLTRWQADGVLDPWGTWIYIQEMKQPPEAETPALADHPTPLVRGEVWSAAFQPIPGNAASMQVTFFAHMAVYRRTENEFTSTMEVMVCPDDPVEIRRIHLHNIHNQPHHLRLTSYGEVILTQQNGDSRHPAFNKLFIESEFVPELDLQIFTRRPRSSDEQPIFLGHMLVAQPQAGPGSKGSFPSSRLAVRHEADRNRFIGRGRSIHDPGALNSDEYLSGTSGATLDPIFALGQEISLNPHESSELAFLTFAGDSREAVLALARRYFNWPLIERSFHQANIAAQTWLGKQNYNSEAFKNTLQVLSALLYPFKAVRAPSETIAANRLGQSGLWRFGISGDYPILLIEIDDPQQVELVREIIQIHEFLRSRRFLVDIVVLNRQQTEYGAELNGMLYRLVSRLNYEQWLNQRGGIFILYADQINKEEYTLLQTAGRFLFKGERGSLAEQMPGYPIQVHHLPEFIPTRPAESITIPGPEEPLLPAPPLQFFNGHGGFSQDGREYIIEVNPGQPTPAPWVNVIGYPGFGFMVSESGSQSTWAINSGENRLTPWSNDPVSDPSGEALYLRDEETGEVWTPTPLPAGADQPYRVTHGAGYTIFEHQSHGLHQRLTLFASPEDPVKIIHLQVKNTWTHTRRITATQFVEWVLGTTHSASMPYIIPEYDASEACLLATNPFSAEFGERAAFLIANKAVHGLTADRTEFLGRGGSYAFPAALRRIGLETRLSPGEDPCAVLQLHLDLLPGGVDEVYFVLGQGSNKEQALALARKYHEPAYVGAALERTHVFWERLLGTIQVHTPEPATDLILNHWMLYQSLSCRIWGRSAFYQPSGAFGFRDQLQDVLAMLPIDPGITRGQILNAAQRQFGEGDVLHWWHPPSGRGVRTRISDDLLWLPYVTALYVETTGDSAILDEKIPFLEAPPLKKDENERYNQYPESKEVFSLLEHCQRAISKGATHGLQGGLPLMGTGDWNDGLNRVGVDGKGESVWLAWFVCDVLERFAWLCDQRGDGAAAKDYRSQAAVYAAAVEKSAWDGAWYRRGSYDDGTPLGSVQEAECQIDAIAQSWAILSGAGDANRSRQAMQSVLKRLVLPQERLSLLFTPPFDKTEHDPGYIKGYLPGIRENGGQYTHAAVWTAWAFATLGDGKQAGMLFDMLNPIHHSDTREKLAEYRVEPYVMCADIYSRAPYLHRGGWTWYTGSAAWMYRLGLDALLGFHKTGDSLRIDPVIPPGWDGFELRYRFGAAHYIIQVLNPNHLPRGVQSVKLDGKVMETGVIPLVDDGQEHKVEVMMGATI